MPNIMATRKFLLTLHANLLTIPIPPGSTHVNQVLEAFSPYLKHVSMPVFVMGFMLEGPLIHVILRVPDGQHGAGVITVYVCVTYYIVSQTSGDHTLRGSYMATGSVKSCRFSCGVSPAVISESLSC